MCFHVGVESVTMNDKLNRKNGNSPRNCQQLAYSHSTPAKKPNVNANMEESPDLYSPSPILPPCTQEGGNEIAWDWQIPSLSRTPESRNKRQNVQCETPKGTKLLQRKRNSNSPLLYKPLKRKTIKMENIENIGKFAAELQALNERMRVIKQNEKSHSSDCGQVIKEEEEAPTLTNTNGKEKTPEIKNNQNSIEENDNDNKQNGIGKTTDHNDSSKKEASGNYGDLFDDSVDDDMIRCTQEIEEKFNLMDKESFTQVKKEESSSNDVSNKTFVQFSSNENCKNPLVRSILGAGDNNTLKTYSKLSLRRDENSSIHAAVQRRKEPDKPCLNNNNTIQSYAKKPCDNKKLPKSNTVDLFDFSDDSFDDWLVTCGVEEEKLLSQSGSLNHKNDSTKFQANYKRLTNAPLKSEAKSADSLKPMAKPETSNYLENRKFFKTKSLSDQYVNRDANTNAKGTTNAPCYSTRPMHLNSSRGPIPRTSVARTTVSTKPIVTNDHKVENNAISLMRGTDRTHGSNINRCAVKSDGDRFVKHHSTGNIINDKPEMTKTGSQPARCTAEEIERKRLQAVARLEARRKLYLTKIPNNIKR